MNGRTPTQVALENLSGTPMQLRKVAAQDLARLLPRRRVLDLQRAFVRESEPGVYKWLAFCLGRLKDPSSLPLLDAKLARTTNQDARDWIMVSAMMIRGKLARAKLIALLGSNDSLAVRAGAMYSWNNSASGCDTVFTLLLRATESTQSEVRRWAALSLGTSSRLTGSGPLLHCLADPDYLVREWVECSLARLGDRSAYPHLLLRLDDPHPRVREWAIKALAACGDARTPAELLERFPDELDEFCRDGILASLMPPSATLEARVALLRYVSRDRRPLVLLSAARLLAAHPEFHDDRSICDVFLQQHVPVYVRDEVVSALTESAAPEDHAGLARVSKRGRVQTVAALRHANGRRDLRLGKEGLAMSNNDVTGRSALDLGGEVDMGVVVALPEEFREFMKIASAESLPGEAHEPYYVFRVSAVDALIRGVASLIGGMGPGPATLTASHLLRRWSPKAIASLGIAAGVHRDIRLGDVVVAKQVDNYLHSSKAEDSALIGEFDLILGGDPYKTDPRFVSAATHYEFAHAEGFRQWQESCAEDMKNSLGDAHATLIDKQLIRERPSLHVLNVASSSIVAASAAFVRWLQRHHDRTLHVVEMESVGVAAAAHDDPSRPRLLVVRGVSDFGDERKEMFDMIGGGAVRGVAMRSATRLLSALIALE